MATFTRLCSDEELQQARDYLSELRARSPIPDEFKHDQGTVGEEKKCKEGKKKTYIMPKEQVEMILNYQCTRPLHGNEIIHKLAQEDEETYGELSTLVTMVGILTRHYQDKNRASQEKLRHEIETKGYYAYEASDHEEEEQGPRGKGGMLTKFLEFLKLVGTTVYNLFKK